MCEEKREYSLLHKFDSKKAQAGEPIHWCNGDKSVTYVAGPDHHDEVCYSTNWGTLHLCDVSMLRMAPLCWVEGKPVYKGDVLWSKYRDSPVTITGYVSNGGCRKSPCLEYDGTSNYLDDFTWTPRKVKKTGWINLYSPTTDRQVATPGGVFDCREEADRLSYPGRLACIQIHW